MRYLFLIVLVFYFSALPTNAGPHSISFSTKIEKKIGEKKERIFKKLNKKSEKKMGIGHVLLWG